MKKLVVMAVLAVAAISASAADVGMRVGRNSGTAANSVGVTLGQKYGVYGVELAYDRSTYGSSNVNRYSVLGSIDVTKFGALSVAAKSGLAMIDSEVGSNGGAFLIGVGVSYPLAKNIAFVADYSYQAGHTRVKEYNGNAISAGIKYSF